MRSHTLSYAKALLDGFKRMRSVCITHYQPTSSVIGTYAAYVKRAKNVCSVCFKRAKNVLVAHWSAPGRRENAKVKTISIAKRQAMASSPLPHCVATEFTLRFTAFLRSSSR